MNLLFTKLNNYLKEKSSYFCKLSETDADVINFYSKYTNQIVFEIVRTNNDGKKIYYLRSSNMLLVNLQILSRILVIIKESNVW